MPNERKHTERKVERLFALTDPEGKNQLTMPEAIKVTNKEFPREKIPSLTVGYQLVSRYRTEHSSSNDGNGKAPLWEDLLETGRKMRVDKNMPYGVIAKHLARLHEGYETPHATTISKYCQRTPAPGGNGNGNGSSAEIGEVILTGKSMRILRAPKKGKVLVEMSTEDAMKMVVAQLGG